MVGAGEHRQPVLDPNLVERGFHGLGLGRGHAPVGVTVQHQGRRIACIDAEEGRDRGPELLVEVDGVELGAALQQGDEVRGREIGDDRRNAIAPAFQRVGGRWISVIGHHAGDEGQVASGARPPNADPCGVRAIVGGVQLDVTHAQPDVRDRVGDRKARCRGVVQGDHGEALVDQRLVAGLTLFGRGPLRSPAGRHHVHDKGAIGLLHGLEDVVGQRHAVAVAIDDIADIGGRLQFRGGRYAKGLAWIAAERRAWIGGQRGRNLRQGG